jgi:pyridoxal phosphate phosphatase PHOSPHO2
MPFLVDVGGALSDINECKIGKWCGQAIISDGNDLFIGAFLKQNQMEDYFSHGIETNAGIWEQNDTNRSQEPSLTSNHSNLKIVYQSAKFGGHSCKTCPPNLCKSQALRDILDRTEQCNGCTLRIVYVGDGSNDACPALHVLGENDILLARCGKRRRDPNSLTGPTADEDSIEGHGQHNFHSEMHVDEFESHVAGAFPILSALRKAKVQNGLEPKCKVYAWRSGRQLRSLIQKILPET